MPLREWGADELCNPPGQVATQYQSPDSARKLCPLATGGNIQPIRYQAYEIAPEGLAVMFTVVVVPHKSTIPLGLVMIGVCAFSREKQLRKAKKSNFFFMVR
ncbi:MAG: hypothetical protein IPQ03_00255 [Bacteroidetes bacterium]|nr:hypothetical protein [Bacteroidota bacterium]